MATIYGVSALGSPSFSCSGGAAGFWKSSETPWEMRLNRSGWSQGVARWAVGSEMQMTWWADFRLCGIASEAKARMVSAFSQVGWDWCGWSIQTRSCRVTTTFAPGAARRMANGEI